MEILLIIFVTLSVCLVLFNLINHKKVSFFSILFLCIIGSYYLIKHKYNELYINLFTSIENIELYVTIISGVSLLSSLIEYILGYTKLNKTKVMNIKSNEEITEKKDYTNELLVYLEMMDEPLACLKDGKFLINNKMKRILKFNDYVIEKKKFNDFIHSSDKNNFYNNEGNVNFRININGEYEWFEGIFSTINDDKYTLIRKCAYRDDKKIEIKTFKELMNSISVYESNNQDYYLVFFTVVNYSDFISFYGKDFTNLAMQKHMECINRLPYISNSNLFYISKNEYVISLDNLIEYNILLSELENNSSIIVKNDIIISDNKICIRGKVGAIASSNVKNKNSSNVINKGFEMVKLASSKDYMLDYAIYHEIDEEIDYSLKDYEIDLDFDFTKYKKRIQ